MIYSTKGKFEYNKGSFWAIFAVFMVILIIICLNVNIIFAIFLVICTCSMLKKCVDDYNEKIKYADSYISLYEDKAEGITVSGTNNHVVIKYNDIKSVGISEDQNQITICDRYGSFTFQAHECAKEVTDIIHKQMELSN